MTTTEINYLFDPNDFTFSFNAQDLSLKLYIEDVRVGRIDLKMGEVSKRIIFYSYDPYTNMEIGFYSDLFKTILELPFSARQLFFKSLDRHSPDSPKPYSFSKTISKLQNIYVLSLKGEINRPIQFTPLKQSELDEICSDVILQNYDNNLPSIPFRLITNILRNKDLLIKLTTNILSLHGGNKFKPRIFNELITSCTHSAALLKALFFGTKRAVQLEKVLSITHLAEGIFLLPSKKKYRYKFTDIFIGKIISEIRREDPELLHSEDTLLSQVMATKSNKFKDSFTKHINTTITEVYDPETYFSAVSDEEGLALFKKSIFSYPFNKQNLDDLIDEIHINTPLIHSECSYCYSISLINPATFSEHAFVLEQFLRTSDNQVCYRIYQSWVGKVTLLEDIQKNGYDEHGNHALNSEEITHYLRKIDAYFINSADRKAKLDQIFGYPFSNPPQVTIFSDHTIASCDLIYWCEKVNPKEILSRFGQFMMDEQEMAYRAISV